VRPETLPQKKRKKKKEKKKKKQFVDPAAFL
jgi:hypothetical protein